MLRITLLYIPVLLLTAGLVLLLNAVGAGAAVSVAVFALFAASFGFAIGLFIDRLPDLSRSPHAPHPPPRR